jgi:hypothetical protein
MAFNRLLTVKEGNNNIFTALLLMDLYLWQVRRAVIVLLGVLDDIEGHGLALHILLLHLELVQLHLLDLVLIKRVLVADESHVFILIESILLGLIVLVLHLLVSLVRLYYPVILELAGASFRVQRVTIILGLWIVRNGRLHYVLRLVGLLLDGGSHMLLVLEHLSVVLKQLLHYKQLLYPLLDQFLSLNIKG